MYYIYYYKLNNFIKKGTVGNYFMVLLLVLRILIFNFSPTIFICLDFILDHGCTQ